jgi:hypothetical protein
VDGARCAALLHWDSLEPHIAYHSLNALPAGEVPSEVET